MAESMANPDQNSVPTESMMNLYRRWAHGGWGMILTGNVLVDPRYLSTPEDLAIDPSILTNPHKLMAWKRWAEVTQSHGTPALVQINHPGRQSALGSGKRGFWEKNIAPSAVPLNFGPGYAAWLFRACIFGTPREMTVREVEDVVERFVVAAKVAKEAGFRGVEIHAAHGYLLGKGPTNHRNDLYGGTPTARAFIIVQIIRQIRSATDPHFAIGIKLNSTDYQDRGAGGEGDLQEQVKCIVRAGVDYVQVSGGTYENLEFYAQTSSPTTSLRESYFLTFASVIRDVVPSNIPLMVTGGFRTRRGMCAAINDGSCDLVGLGRPAVIEPGFPKRKVLSGVSEEEAGVVVEIVEGPWPGVLKWLGLEKMGWGARLTSIYVAKMKDLAREEA
ncbi:MAG: hypothetical protein M1839_007704 [Geoglossum umbratile]|nr:MAG: hypothetical protein M1839_007704 [Geoglossum umbratile]